MKLFIGLSLLLVQVWATQEGQKEGKKGKEGKAVKVHAWMDDASFESKSLRCNEEFFIDSQDIKTSGSGDTSKDFKLISVICGKQMAGNGIIVEPSLEYRIYRKGTLITKFSKRYPTPRSYNSGRSEERERPEGRGGPVGLLMRMGSSKTFQTDAPSNELTRSITRAVEKFMLKENDNVVNSIMIEPSDSEENSFSIYFKKSLFETKVLEKNIIKTTDCFQVKVFVLQRSLPKEATNMGSMLRVLLGSNRGSKNGGTDNTFMTWHVASLPKPAESSKCPAGGGSTPTTPTSTDEEKGSEPEDGEPETEQ